MGRASWIGVACLWLFGSTSCATTFYEGRERAPSEAAILESKDSVIDEIDGTDLSDLRDPRDKNRFVLPPGPHLVAFGLRLVTPGLLTTQITTTRGMRVCLIMLAGHRYTTETLVFGRSWEPAVFDEQTGTVPLDCSLARLAAPLAAAGVVLPPPTPQDPGPAPAPPPLGGQPPSVAGAPAPAAAAPPATAPPVRAVSPARAIVDLWSEEEITRSHRRPLVEFTIGSGYAFGGDNLLTAEFSNGDHETIAAGGGFFADLGAMVTPLWLADRVGLGAGAEIGVKFDDVNASNASASFTRFPAKALLHVFVRAGDRWFLYGAGGIEKDLAATLSGEGDASALNINFTSHTGRHERLGLYFRQADHFMMNFMLALTQLTFDAPAGSVSGSSFSAAWQVGFAL